MATTTISYYRVTELGDPSKPVSFNVFYYREDAEKWIESRKEDLDLSIESGWLKGVEIHETQVPAMFIIGKPTMSSNYLGFGARVLADIKGYKVIGVALEHARWQTMRLASGMELASRDLGDGYLTLEEAVEDATRLANGETLYPYEGDNRE